MCEKDVVIQTHPCGEYVITWDTQEDQNMQTQETEEAAAGRMKRQSVLEVTPMPCGKVV